MCLIGSGSRVKEEGNRREKAHFMFETYVFEDHDDNTEPYVYQPADSLLRRISSEKKSLEWFTHSAVAQTRTF